MWGEAILNAENSGKPLGGRGSAPNPAVGAHSAHQDPIATGEGACCSLPRTPPPLLAFGLDFRPFGPRSEASHNSLHFLLMLRGLDKTLAVPIFRAKECIRMQDFVFKISKYPGSPRGGRGDIFSHPSTQYPPPNAGAPPLHLGWLRRWLRP